MFCEFQQTFLLKLYFFLHFSSIDKNEGFFWIRFDGFFFMTSLGIFSCTPEVWTWCPDKACVCWRLWELKVSPYQDCLSPKKGVKQRHWYDTNLESSGVTLPFFMWNIRTYRSNSDKYGSKNLDWGEKNNLSINLDSAVASLIIFSLWAKCEKAG